MPHFTYEADRSIWIDISDIHFVWEVKDKFAEIIGVPRICQQVICRDWELSDERHLRSTIFGTRLRDECGFNIRYEYVFSPQPLLPYINYAIGSLLYPLYEYKKRTSNEAWTYLCQSPLYVNQLLRQQPYFQKRDPAPQLLKKNLIVSDWTAEQWDATYLARVNECLRHYRQEGHSIYLMLDNELVKLEGNIETVHQKKMAPRTSAAILAQAKQKKMPIDAVHILDAIELTHLLTHRANEKHSIDAHFYQRAHHNKADLIEVLKEARLHSIRCTSFPEGIAAAQELAQQLSLTVQYEPNSFNLNEKILDDFLANAAFELNNERFTAEQFINLETLSLLDARKGDPHTTAMKVETLLTKFSNLKQLRLTGCEGINAQTLKKAPLASLKTLMLEVPTMESADLTDILHHCEQLNHLSLNGYALFTASLFNNLSFPFLSSLNLSGNSINLGDLFHYLPQINNIKELNLAFCNIVDNVNHEVLDLKNLLILNLKQANLSDHTLCTLLNSTNQLKILNLARCKKISKLNRLSLTSLEELDLSNSFINDEGLSNLLKNAPQLKKLNLDGCKEIKKFIPFSLTHLEELGLRDTAITDEGLYNLLNNAHQLKILNLSWCKNVSKLDRLSLTSLEELELRDVSITDKGLYNLLNNAYQLKKLNLACCKNISKIDSLSLTHLEELCLRDTAITDEGLSNLLKNAPQLKKLNLDGCEEIKKLVPFSFTHLEEINLCRSSIDDEGLYNLLNNAHQLKKLNLPCCNNISKLDRISLASLEELNLRNVSITDEELYNLLNNAPQLKKLDLAWCKNIRKLDRLSLTSLEELDLTNASITDEGLYNLLNNAHQLKKLNLAWSKNISKIDGLSLTSLEELDLTNASITDEGLYNLLKNAPELKQLNLLGCGKIKKPVPLSLTSLEKLDLTNASITDEGLYNLLKNAPELKQLNLRGCKEIKKPVPLSLTSLEELDLTYASITGEGLYNLLSNASQLKKLNLTQCKNLRNISPELQILLDKIASVLYPNLPVITISDAIFPTLPTGRQTPKDTSNCIPDLNFSGSSSKHTEDIQDAEYVTNPIHNSKDLLTKFRAPQNPAPFKYKGSNKTKNQGMIIEKISQYLILKKQNLDWIPRIKDGICVALSTYCISHSVEEWKAHLNLISQWNGQKDSLSHELATIFNQLLQYIEAFQFNGTTERTFIGDFLVTYLNNCSPSQSLMLTNPWHAVALGRIDAQNWFFYEPNRVDGGTIIPTAKLGQAIHLALGSLISIPGISSTPCRIQNPALFIEHGGLLALCRSSNQSAMLQALDLTDEKINTLAPCTFDGLFLPGVGTNTPAWVLGLRSTPEIQILTEKLIAKYKALCPDAVLKLTESEVAINAVNEPSRLQRSENDAPLPAFNDLHKPVDSEHTKKEPPIPFSMDTLDVDGINEPNTGNKPTLEEVLEPQEDSLLASSLAQEYCARDYSALFATWEKKPTNPLPLKRYYQQLLHPQAIKNRLIEVSSDTELQGLKAGLYDFCQSNFHLARPIFFIQSPDDLVCSAPFMRVLPDGRSGEVIKGPGGALHEFLQSSTPENPPLLVVDYSKFDPSDMVRFNSLLDAQRKADGVDVPPEVTIIGVMDTSRANPQGSDFYSRFDKHEHCPFNAQELAGALPLPLLQKAPASLEEASFINLFHAKDWKERLIGRWVLQGQTLTWEEGLLTPAFAEGQPIVIQNGLSDDPDFKQFWEVVALTRFFPHPIKPLLLSADKPIIFYQQEGYDWDALIEQTQWDDSFDPAGITLNSSSITQLFQRYKVQDNELQTLEGLLAEHARTKSSERLHLNLSCALSEDEWAECLATAKKLELRLFFHLQNDIALPQPLKERVKLTNNAKPLFLNKDLLLLSTDIDTSVASLVSDLPDADIIDVSECDASDLFTSLSGNINDKTLRFEFEQRDKAVKKALQQGKTVILKGSLSPELTDSLVEVVLQRQFAEEPLRGHLIIVTDETSSFPQELLHHDRVLARDKKQQLSISDEELKRAGLQPLLETASLAELKTRLAYYRRHQDPNTDKAWEGMDHLEIPILKEFIPEQSREQADAFKAERRKAVRDLLETEPYAFLTGLTGVGKSTFMEEEFGSSEHYYQGESQLKNWAKDGSQTLKVLFIDEANLSKRQWSECEGLFNDPRSILIDGEKKSLDAYHKIIFAGNPFSYADERTRAAFFKRHGNAILFQPLPLALIYEDVLSPIFNKPPLQDIRAQLVAPILKSYQFITERSIDEVRISPRELQMMALLTLSYCESHPTVNPEVVAYFYAHQIARPLVPAAHLNGFDEEMPAPPPLERSISSNLASFLITDSRQAITQQLNDLLALSRYRREAATIDVQRYGGLGGIILEGDPGIGKSELVTQILVANGYQELHQLSDKPEEGLFFLRLPASLSITEKEGYLTYAFKNGLVVIADEINSSPMMERLLNSLLMGTTLTGERPEKPGFMVIGTQNPITMPGRLAPSTALARRLLTIELPPYTALEMQHILIKKGLEEQEASDLVNAYETQLAFGKQHFLSPLPCFRDLLKVAEALLMGRYKSPNKPKVLGQGDKKMEAPVPNSAPVPATPIGADCIRPSTISPDEPNNNVTRKRENFFQILDSDQDTHGQGGIEDIDSITKDELLRINSIDTLTNILSAPHHLQQPTSEMSKKELARLSAQAYSESSPAWQALGISLIFFGAAVLVFIGILAAIPTTGASLAGALGIVSLVAAGGVLSMGAGALSFFYGREKGMTNDISQLQNSMKNNEDAVAFSM